VKGVGKDASWGTEGINLARGRVFLERERMDLGVCKGRAFFQKKKQKGGRQGKHKKK